MLPPSTVAGVSVVCAAAAWIVAEPLVIRSLAGAAAAAAVVGAIVMRRWDRHAGKRVAELTRARASDQWKHEEHIAELESDLDESRELRGKLEAKVRSKRAELAALRTEHAALLRRYATAETERASALEGRRQLAIEAAAPAKALPPAGGEARRGAPTPALYLRADAALMKLARKAGEVPAQRDVDQSETAQSKADQSKADQSKEEAGAPQGKPVAADAHAHQRAAAPAPTSRHYAVPAAAAVVPHAPVRRSAVGGFDFFGTKAGQSPAALEAVQNEDLADVVGAEALAVHKADAEAGFKPAGPAERAVGQVIDLTAHDETEQLDVAELRTAIS